MLSFSNVREARKFIAQRGIEFVSLHLSDIDGRLRAVTLPSENFTQKAIEEGVGFDASNLGFATVAKSDMIIRPDLGFAFEDPVDEGSHVLSFFCHVLEADGQEHFGQDLRHIVAKAVGALKAEGVADEVRVGVELEFNVVDELRSIMTPRETSFRVESSELASPAGGEEVYRIFTKRGYFRSEPNDHQFALRNEIVRAFKKVGLETKYHHHEVGSSQGEIEFTFQPVEFMADATVLAKNLCHRIAAKHGKVITFIPKLIPGEAGNGMHVHQFFRRRGRNAFHDPSGLYQLSETALGAIAGILTHASSLLAFTNPTTNSYRRLMPGFEAPVKAAFAMGNRSAAIRIPAYVQDPEERRFEFRTIDATCNPYLAYAAMIMAALDGIVRKVDPRAEGFGPHEANLYELPAEALARIRSFPTTLEAALGALAADREYLTAHGVFPPHLVDRWIAAKTKDTEEMRGVPHPWEIARYYDL